MTFPVDGVMEQKSSAPLELVGIRIVRGRVEMSFSTAPHTSFPLCLCTYGPDRMHWGGLAGARLALTWSWARLI